MQKEQAMFNRVFSTAEQICKINFSIKGVKCDKADLCDYANDHCKRIAHEINGPFSMVCDPTKRWMYCYEWKRKLGMVFDKDLGVYILPQWKEELLRRANQK